MPLRLSTALAAAMANAVAAASDNGADSAKIRVYTGAQPATPDTAASGTLLVEFDLPEPAFGAPADTAGGAVLTGNAIPEVPAAATGTAGWFRMLDGDGDALLDGHVTDTAGDGILKLSSTALIQNIDVAIVSLTVTQPKA